MHCNADAKETFEAPGPVPEKTRKREPAEAGPDGPGEGVQRLAKHMKLKNPSKYKHDWDAFMLFADTMLPNKPDLGWGQYLDGKLEATTLPDISKDLVSSYAGWLLEPTNKYKKGNLELCRTAINHYYESASITSPWRGPSFARIMSAYIVARKEQAIENGEDNAAGLRVPVPEDTIMWMMQLAETLPNDAEAKSAYTLMCLGAVCLLRASSISFLPEHIRMIKDSDGKSIYMVVTSTTLKMQSNVPSSYKQLRMPAPDSSKGPKHPRARLFKLVEEMLDSGYPDLIKDPATAHATITKWMKDLVPAEVTCLPEGHHISSHSLRKAGASALFKLGCDVRQVIMPWGRWKSATCADVYFTKDYVVSRFFGGNMTHVPPASFERRCPVPAVSVTNAIA